jgi:hypothetical protein
MIAGNCSFGRYIIAGEQSDDETMEGGGRGVSGDFRVIHESREDSARDESASRKGAAALCLAVV